MTDSDRQRRQRHRHGDEGHWDTSDTNMGTGNTKMKQSKNLRTETNKEPPQWI